MPDSFSRRVSMSVAIFFQWGEGLAGLSSGSGERCIFILFIKGHKTAPINQLAKCFQFSLLKIYSILVSVFILFVWACAYKGTVGVIRYTSIMEARVQKLLILAGEEGEGLESRDYKKLSEVIVGEYLPATATPYVKHFFAEFIPKVARAVPLKAHFYAAITSQIAKSHSELAGKIVEAQLQHLQADLAACKWNEALNSLNFLSEAMNISFFNSLTFMNILQDILNAQEKETQALIRRGLAQLLVRALPLCARSLHEKTSHQFRKFMERLRKAAEGDELAKYMYAQFSKGSIRDYSAISRLSADFSVEQIQCKFKLHIDLKAMRGKEISLTEYYRFQRKGLSGEYSEYRRSEGAVMRSLVELLVDCFSKNSAILTLKLNNLIKPRNDILFIKNLVDTLVLRGLRSKHGVAEFSLLVSLKNASASEHLSVCLQDLLVELFNAGEDFELSLLLTFARLFSFLLCNWKEEFEWGRLLAQEQNFVKRKVLLKLILEQIALLNDKFICPPLLQAYEPSRPAASYEEYTSTTDLQIFQNFETLLKAKTEASGVVGFIDSERKYEIFLQALFRRTCNSQTHLHILEGRYHQILVRFSEWDWDLINKIRNFFRNSIFHRLLYLRFLIRREVIKFASYVKYVGSLKDKTDIEMIWIRMELNELNAQFGKTLRKQ